MYYVKKRLEISAAHYLKLDYDSKCSKLHGHNWIITVHLKSKILNENGMIMDFTDIKKGIQQVLDHKIINDVLGDINPTAENIAKWIADRLGAKCFMVEVQESENNIAIFEKDNIEIV